MSAFVVTTSILGSSRTQVWESSEPLALGHPFRWVLERSDSGIRIRDLSGDVDSLRQGAVHEIPFEQMKNGASLDLPRDFKFMIRPVREAEAAFKNAGTGSSFRVYRCSGQWALESQVLERSYSARRSGKTVFVLKPGSAGSWTLKPTVEGLKLCAATGAPRNLKKGETVQIHQNVLAGGDIRFDAPEGALAMSWRFGLTNVPSFVDGNGTGLAEADSRADAEWFKRALVGASVALLLFGLLAWFWPPPQKETELVPAQFTQILMPKVQKAPTQASSESGAPSAVAKELPKKVQEAAVVQAFRAKALTNAVSGLLKGGMTKLLAQSDFVSGATHSAEARRILDTRNTALQPTTNLSSLTGGKNVQIASIGGTATGTGGHAIGYGKGEHTALKGQGKGFVPFVQADSNGSVVDEGLTRDEVGEVIHRHLSEVRYCYESAMIREPDIEGKLMVAFVIGGNGSIKSADAKSSTVPDPRLDDCIIRRLVTWTFPKPRGGVDVAVTYPFIFKTLGR